MSTDQDNTISSMPYHPELIADLHNEHSELLDQLEQIEKNIDKQDFKVVAQQLRTFKSMLLAHVSQENLKLYVYLQITLKDNAPAYQKMRNLRKEMDSILISLLTFFQEYDDIGHNKQLQMNLKADFLQVRTNYIKRIKVEDNYLFPLYKAKKAN